MFDINKKPQFLHDIVSSLFFDDTTIGLLYNSSRGSPWHLPSWHFQFWWNRTNSAVVARREQKEDFFKFDGVGPLHQYWEGISPKCSIYSQLAFEPSTSWYHHKQRDLRHHTSI